MSQANSAFSEGAVGASLPYAEKNAPSGSHISNTLEDNSRDTHTPKSPNSFPLQSSYFHLDESFHRNLSTNFSGYAVDQEASVFPLSYPTPTVDLPNPYPLQLQQSYQPNPSASNPHQHVPTHSRSTWGNLYPPPHNFNRRRSLSQGDVDMVAAASNPTFVRLQAPRSRSTGPEGNSRRQNRTGRGFRSTMRRTYHSTSVRPRSQVGPNAMLPPTPVETLIGTPLSISRDLPTSTNRKGAHAVNSKNIPLQLTGPGSSELFHMSHADQLGNSRRVIEVGAMAVLQHRREATVMPQVSDELTQIEVDSYQSPSEQGGILGRLEDLGEQLRLELRDSGEAMKGYEMIRRALASRAKGNGIAIASKEEQRFLRLENRVTQIECTGHFVAPTDIFAAKLDDVYDNGALDDGDLFTSIMKEDSTPSP